MALDVASIQRLSVCYQEYFNSRRPHQGTNDRTPAPIIDLSSRRVQNREIRCSKTAEIDGLITSFKIAGKSGITRGSNVLDQRQDGSALRDALILITVYKFGSLWTIQLMSR